jgi:hypothetical protein
MAWSSKPYENVALLTFDFLARIIAMRIDAGPPFSALFTLWLSVMAAEFMMYAAGVCPQRVETNRRAT